MNHADDDYQRIERAILYLEKNVLRQPSLADLAHELHLSEFHFQRLFRRWAGISPKRFLQILTVELAKNRLAQRGSVLDAAWDAGLSGPSRLHDLFVAIDAVTPGEFKARGRALTIDYGCHPTPFGQCLVAVTARGICHMSFMDARDDAARAELFAAWPAAEFRENPQATGVIVARIFAPREGQKLLPLLLVGTNFQAKVWSALLRIPPGTTATYSDLAHSIGQPRAARAVGQAVASNTLAYLIPCHRVIRKMGVPGNYRWGAARKKAMLLREAALR